MNARLICRRTVTIAATALLSCVSAGAFAAPVGGAARPKVKFVKAPPTRTTDTVAEFRFRTGARATWCRRDDRPYRRCRLRARYSRLRAGRHTFTVKARHRGRTTFARHRWTIVPTTRAPAPPGVRDVPATPAPLPAAPGSRGPLPGTGGSGAGIGVDAYGRRLVFGDEFDGPSLDPTVWHLYHGPGNEGYGLRRPSALSLDGQGNLVVTGEMVNGQIVSGGMAGRLDFTYGRVEFRVRTETDPTGTMSADVLTWPKQQWSPEFTENDMYETGMIPNNTFEFSTFIHFGTSNWQKWFKHQKDPSQWHTIAMEWYPDMLEIYVDGPLAFRVSDPVAIPDVLHHVCIQLDARVARTLSRPVRMFVDYIRVYQ